MAAVPIMRVILPAPLLLALAAPCGAAPPDAAALLQRVADAARTNRREAAPFVYIETIRTSEYDASNRLLDQLERTFEVTFLEGEPYHRLIGENGAQLSPALTGEEEARLREVEAFRKKTPFEARRRHYADAERQRLKLDLELLPSSHRASLAGEIVYQNRPTWLLDVQPTRLRKPKYRGEWAKIVSGRLWVDQATCYPVHAELDQNIEWGGLPAGSHTSWDWIRLESAWLISRIDNTAVYKRGKTTVTRRTLQTYSHYQRFRTSSVLIFGDPP
jgi:hypothetical protein